MIKNFTHKLLWNPQRSEFQKLSAAVCITQMEYKIYLILIFYSKCKLQKFVSYSVLNRKLGMKQNYKHSFLKMLSTTTPVQIRNNPSNSSPSKQQWSFGRAQRFKNPKPNCSQSAYNNRTCLSERKTSFGYGGRTKYFDGIDHVPEGGHYEPPSDFDMKKSNKGYSFTANRENLIFDHYAKTMEATPDPLTYEQDSNQVKKMRAYSLRPKTAYPNNYFLPSQSEKQKKKQLPGPGKYETIDVLGKSYQTKSKNDHARSFSHGKRFNSGKVTPGPMDYANKTIQADGIYLLSNMKGSGRRTFLNGKRKLKLDVNDFAPGPGTYRAPSDFGHYQEPIRPSTARA